MRIIQYILIFATVSYFPEYNYHFLIFLISKTKSIFKLFEIVVF